MHVDRIGLQDGLENSHVSRVRHNKVKRLVTELVCPVGTPPTKHPRPGRDARVLPEVGELVILGLQQMLFHLCHAIHPSHFLGCLLGFPSSSFNGGCHKVDSSADREQVIHEVVGVGVGVIVENRLNGNHSRRQLTVQKL